MNEVGVIAVVKELQKFLGDMKKVNSALDGLRPSGTLLQQMFESVGSAVSNFGASVARVVETALGVMLRDAIEFIIGKLRDLIAAIIETGSQFQLLKIRLTGLNLNEFADGTRSFATAMEMAKVKTQEEITWLQTLGAQTPFDPAQIADTYTQARAFGFAADEAKRLTTDIINYTAGMGLSNETLFLVIQNLGQMVQRGKITGTEIRDLARGSFLPLSDVLERIAKNMGITVKELTQRISTPEGIPAQEFVKAFEQMVEQEPRFVGAAGRMSRALVPAAQNVKELFTSIFGLNVVTPIFDIIGEKVAGLVDQFVYFNEQGDLIKTDVWNNLVAAATNLGIAIGEVIKELLGFLPTGRNLAEMLVNAIQGIAVWIKDNKDAIVGFFVSIANAINTWVIIPFQRISAWVVENWPIITGFFGALGEIISEVFGRLFGGEFAKGDFLGGILDALKTFMLYVTENKDQIATWITAFIRVVAAVELVLTVFNVLIGVIGAVIGFWMSLIGVVLAVAGTLTFFLSPIGLIIAGLSGLAVAVAAIAAWFIVHWTAAHAVTAQFANSMVSTFQAMANGLAQIGNSIWNFLKTGFSQLWNSIKSIDWGGLGRSIISGITSGVTSAASSLIGAVTSAVTKAYNAASNFLKAKSPSKLFEQLGAYTMEGFAQGIDKYANTAAGAMGMAMQRVTMPAMTMPSIIHSVVAQAAGNTTNNNETRNYNLTVNSGASSEPVISDFNMMASLAGA